MTTSPAYPGSVNNNRDEVIKVPHQDWRVTKETTKIGKLVPAEPGEWIRPLGSMEAFMAVGGDYGLMNTVQAVWLSSFFPIRPLDVAEAVRIVTSNIELFQTKVVRRFGRYWYRKMPSFMMDFAVCHDDPMKVFESIIDTPPNIKEGPMWFVRFVPLPLHSGPMGMVHEAVLYFCIHHTITDGTTNMFIIRDVLRVVNAMLKGGTVILPFQPVPPSFTDDLVTSKSWPYIVKLFSRKFFYSMMNDYNAKTPFKSVFNPDSGITLGKTRVLAEELEIDETKKFIGRCKAAKVTVHSCVVAVARVALHNILQKYSSKPTDSVAINIGNCVNTRRYLPSEFKELSGCHISLEEEEIMIHAQDVATDEAFWALAKRVNVNLRHSLNVDKMPIKNAPLYRPASMVVHANYFLTRHGRRNRMDCHMITTNMGDLTQFLPENHDSDPIQMNNYLRTVSGHLAANPCTLAFHTLRGRFMISLDCYCNKMPEVVSTDLFETLVSCIKRIAEVGGIH